MAAADQAARHLRTFEKRRRDIVRTGFHRHAHAQPGVHGVARLGGFVEHRRQIGRAADGREMNPLAVHGELHLVRRIPARA